jgi:hypothetical protein
MKYVLFLFALSLPVSAFAAPSGTLTGINQTLRWDGAHFVNQNTPRPELCNVLGCDEFDVAVDAGGSIDWTITPGGLEISIAWGDETQEIDLYVYGADGSIVAQSTGFGTKAQSVLIPAPADATYRAVVVPFSTTDVTYRGLAEFETSFPTKLGDRLPNLHPLKPTNFVFAIGTYTLTPVDTRPLGENAPSCYPEEITEQGARRCLRFDAGSENVSPDGQNGRFELRIDISNLVTKHTVEQAIYRSDGTKRYRPAGDYTFHPTHGHIHYRNFAKYELFAVNPPSDPDHAGFFLPAAKSRKADFCMIDVENRKFDGDWAATQGNEPRQGAFPDCNIPTDVDRKALKGYMVQGISRGWADVYSWPLPGQYIEVSGVPDGDYDVVVTVNPFKLIEETDYDDNVACTRIHLAGKTVSELPAAQQPATCPQSFVGSPAPSPIPLDVGLPGTE